ncbi:16S rRNA (cytosine(967)-C(5))-methyltransferase [Waterburya agarophytonicola K14]|uniref:16S rRNA (cytosine(967)-C(5))-methyltransferase n=1 Tax=Waterburya agarophytonicola KI4 TaxID=2874699 RepID=A0A964BNX9_9CYAN|nr:16S rRNA (cytosine(967)-C(5))-methyltransferase [Waterburya agarophytonicola]MCC0176121.1 16S rRNA (cytosine(967)-C(5))-methyltransferase [Waterburya agarophytonicola KI4]
MASIPNSRTLAFLALKNIYQKKAYTDIALNRAIKSVGKSIAISQPERSFACELVYGTLRRQRTLDALIDLLGKKKANQQHPDLRIILHLGLYQLRYLDRIPSSAAVNTSVELAKENSIAKLGGVVNGLLRGYIRQAELGDPLKLPADPIARLGILHSFPDWMVEIWLEQLPIEEVDRLLAWFNQSPKLDLRVNILKITIAEVETAFKARGVAVTRIPGVPQGLRLESAGAITDLPGYKQGWWVIQDSSAQLVSHLLDPQPGETIIDACAAPGGKTTHIAELMGDKGRIIACDRDAKRLHKVRENAARLELRSIKIQVEDSRDVENFIGVADRVLLDAPCSGLGTLHKRPDIRWRKTLESVEELFPLQQELLEQAATWVKPKGVLVYATCTLNLSENEKIVKSFLENYPNWSIQSPPNMMPKNLAMSNGWIKVYPHLEDMDGFFMVRLVRDR